MYQVVEFIKDKNLSYYRKIINIRILSEIDKNKSSKFKNIYNYCSAVLHNIKREDIYNELNELNICEQDIINSILDNYHINIETIPNDYFKDFNISELSNFEKIISTSACDANADNNVQSYHAVKALDLLIEHWQHGDILKKWADKGGRTFINNLF